MTSGKRPHSEQHMAQGLRWRDIRESLIERIWKGYLYMALVSIPAAILRIWITGWRPLYTVHASVATMVLICFALRKKISPAYRSLLTVFIPCSIGLPAVVTFGLISNGVLWLVMACVLAGFLYSQRVALISAVLTALIVAAMAVTFISGYAKLPENLDRLVADPSIWLATIFGTLVFTGILVVSISVFKESVQTLLVEVQSHRDAMEHQANHDQLTGLPSLGLANDRLEMALNLAHRNGGKTGLMFIDLDGFKLVNDEFGHEAGDYVLREVAQRLVQVVRTTDTVARIGGDEFLVILSVIPEAQVAAEIAKKIIAIVSEPVLFKHIPLVVGCSIGISLYPDHADNSLNLRRAADFAMYGVKRAAKNNFAFSDAGKTGKAENSTREDPIVSV